MFPYCPSQFARQCNPIIDANTAPREQCNRAIFFGSLIWSQTRKGGEGRHSLIVGGRRSHGWLSMEACADRRSELHEVGMLGPQLLESFFIAFQVGFENVSHLVFKLLSLVAMMQGLDGLLEPDGNEKAYRDSRNVY